MARRRLSVDAVRHGIGAQLRSPSGAWGHVAGRAMGLANARPNALAIAALSVKEGERVLELGCGPGHALHGLDWSEVMLAQAEHRNRRALEAGRLALVRGDFARLPFGDTIVEAVLAVNVAYFMQSSGAIREAHRVLCANGRIVLYATDGAAMSRWPFAGPDTHRLFDRDRLAALIVEAGFATDRVRIHTVNAGFGVSGLLAVAEKCEG
jgi:SAM-dependent methyltransferase